MLAGVAGGQVWVQVRVWDLRLACRRSANGRGFWVEVRRTRLVWMLQEVLGLLALEVAQLVRALSWVLELELVFVLV